MIKIKKFNYLIILFLVYSCSKPVPSEKFEEVITIFSEPIQKNVKPEIIKTVTHDRFDWTITKLAEYNVSGIIRSTENYSSRWNSYFSPLDICLSWGNLNKPEVNKHIKYSQSGRWYYFRYDGSCPVSKNYILDHSCNIHIIPANDNIELAVKSVNEKDRIRLIGYLIRIDGKSKENGTRWWVSSLSRTDRGDGSCEVMYVTEVHYNNNIYK